MFEMGLITDETVKILERWCDAMMRLEGGQLRIFLDILAGESERTNGFHSHSTLANDRDGYKVIQIAAILNHPCQKCAEDKDAWHTRAGFCQHK